MNYTIQQQPAAFDTVNNGIWQLKIFVDTLISLDSNEWYMLSPGEYLIEVRDRLRIETGTPHDYNLESAKGLMLTRRTGYYVHEFADPAAAAQLAVHTMNRFEIARIRSIKLKIACGTAVVNRYVKLEITSGAIITKIDFDTLVASDVKTIVSSPGCGVAVVENATVIVPNFDYPIQKGDTVTINVINLDATLGQEDEITMASLLIEELC